MTIAPFNPGAWPSPHYASDVPFHQVAAVPASRPTRHMNGPVGPILNQGQTVQCTAFDVAFLKGVQERKEPALSGASIPKLELPVFDPAWLYQAGGGTPSGSTARAMLEACQAQGIPTVDPATGQVRDDAASWKLGKFWAVDVSYEAIRDALLTVPAVAFSCEWPDPFFADPIAPNAILQPPSGHTTVGHSFCMFGYDDRQLVGAPGPGLVACANSWGTAWGHNGFFYIPAAYIAQLGWEAWAAYDIPGDVPTGELVAAPEPGGAA